MSNSDTIFALQGTGLATPPRNQLAALSALGTTATLLTMGSDSGTNVTAFMPFPGATGIYGASNSVDPNANAAVLLDNTGGKSSSVRGASRPYYNTFSFDARGFRLRLQGRFLTSAASNTLTVTFYQNTIANGPVVGSGHIIGTVAIGAAGIGNAVASSFIAECTGMWDSVSGNMYGAEIWGAAAGFYGARAVGQATPFAVAAPLSSSLMFATMTFVAGAANTLTPIEFAFEDV
jgi:hypothetical protein